MLTTIQYGNHTHICPWIIRLLTVTKRNTNYTNLRWHLPMPSLNAGRNTRLTHACLHVRILLQLPTALPTHHHTDNNFSALNKMYIIMHYIYFSVTIFPPIPPPPFPLPVKPCLTLRSCPWKPYFRSASQEILLHSISARLNLISSFYQRLAPLELYSFKCW